MTLQAQDPIGTLSSDLRGFLDYMNITELDNGFYLGRSQERLVELIHEFLNHESDNAFDHFIDETYG